MSLCILAAGKVTTLAVTAFTLSWTHSIERTQWEEQWAVTDAGLVVESARIEGSGAGMEPGPDAVFDGTGWTYRPDLPPQAELVLADSGRAGTWELCASGDCMSLGGEGGEPVVLRPCAP